MDSVSDGAQAESKRFETRITSQGQVSVPAAIRKKLGVEPGSTLQWIERDDEVVVKRRASRSSFDDIHRILFPDGPPKKVLTHEDMDEAIMQYMRKKHGRR